MNKQWKIDWHKSIVLSLVLSAILMLIQVPGLIVMALVGAGAWFLSDAQKADITIRFHDSVKKIHDWVFRSNSNSTLNNSVSRLSDDSHNSN